MIRFLGLLLVSGLAQADVVAEARAGNMVLELHSDAGPCVGSARWAILIKPPERIPGCWILTTEGVQIAFLDGQMARVPIQAFREPSLVQKD